MAIRSLDGALFSRRVVDVHSVIFFLMLPALFVFAVAAAIVQLIAQRLGLL